MALIRMTRRPPMMAFDEPFINDLPDRLRRMLEGTVPIDAVQNVSWMPAVEIVEKNGALVVTAELPGIAPDSVDISIEDDVLTVSGEKSDERRMEDKEAQFYLWERRYGAFRRSFTLPNAVDQDKVTATFDRGVLTITMPRASTPKPKGRKIAIVERK